MRADKSKEAEKQQLLGNRFLNIQQYQNHCQTMYVRENRSGVFYAVLAEMPGHFSRVESVSEELLDRCCSAGAVRSW
jgi:hypothetical protein